MGVINKQVEMNTLTERIAALLAEVEKKELAREIKDMTFFEVYNKMKGHNLQHNFIYCKDELFTEQTFFDLNYQDICITIFRVGNDNWELGESVEVYVDDAFVVVVNT